jgi:hypothetical protein
VTGPRVHISLTADRCDQDGCELTGYHFHWRGRTYRTAFGSPMTAEEAAAFDADCAADHAEREEARR